jgi:hypothetical protein
MGSICGWDDNKISFVLSVCLCVCLGFSCVRKSQAISTELGMEAQNLKGKDEFVCGANRILTSGFMPPSWILAYYSIDRLALATLVSLTLYNFWTARPILSKFGGQLWTHKGYYPKCSNLPKSNLVSHFQVLHFLVLHFQRPNSTLHQVTKQGWADTHVP